MVVPALVDRLVLAGAQVLAAHLRLAQAGDGAVDRGALALAEVGGEQAFDRADAPGAARRELRLVAVAGLVGAAHASSSFRRRPMQSASDSRARCRRLSTAARLLSSSPAISPVARPSK